MALRPELNAALNPAGLKPEDLVTLSDLPREGLNPQDTRWLLVDHNALTGDLATPFSNLVIGCIDHHDDEGVVPHDLPPDQPRVFAKCGSCMSLVLDHCQPTWDRLVSDAAPCEDGTPAAACDAQLARVALAPILIDTTNLTSKDKTTDRDRRAVELAESRLTAPPESSSDDKEEYDRAAYYDRLSELKEQILGLSYRDVLRKDYKRWTEGQLSVGISTVVRGFAYALAEVGDKDKDKFLEALRGWAGEQRLDVAAVMTVSKPDGVFTRELLVWGLNEEGVKVVRQFGRKFQETLGLETWEGGELDGGGETKAEWRVCWRQTRTEHSRKQVAPMMREAMKESSRL